MSVTVERDEGYLENVPYIKSVKRQPLLGYVMFLTAVAAGVATYFIGPQAGAMAATAMIPLLFFASLLSPYSSPYTLSMKQ